MTFTVKLVNDARLEEHLGKPTWAAKVRRWAKEFDREAVLSAERSTPRRVPWTVQQRRLPGGRSPTGVPLLVARPVVGEHLRFFRDCGLVRGRPLVAGPIGRTVEILP
jgi:hypothetical protein